MEREQLLDAIVAQPDDDEPRWIYADWLEEQGDELAEFIRLQVAREQVLTDAFVPASDLKREEQLLVTNYSKWTSGLGEDVEKCRFRRGLIHACELKASRFLEKGHQLLDNAPLEWIRLPYLSGKVAKLIDSGLAGRIRGLQLNKLSLPLVQLQELFQSLEQVSRLDISGAKFAVDGSLAKAMLDSPLAENLEELHVRDVRVESQFFGTFGKEKLKRLKRLEFGNEMGGIRPAHFARKPFPNLEHLSSHVGARVADMEQLSKLHPLKRIEFWFRAPHRGMKLLIENQLFTKAEVIRTGGINEKNALALLEMGLPECRLLDLGGTVFSARFWEHFVNLCPANLEVLHANPNNAELAREALPFVEYPETDWEEIYFDLELGLFDE